MPTTIQDSNKVRDSFFDNAKFLLIAFVVIAHGLSPFKQSSHIASALWAFFNAFHMPAFIFVSGYFAKSYLKNNTFNIAKPFKYLMLYLFSQFAVTTFEKFVLHVHVSYSFFYARSSLWFLLCLVLWHIMLPFATKLKCQYALAIAFIAGLLVGYDKSAGLILSGQRAFVHFPFFLLGFYCTKERIYGFLNKKWSRPVGACVIVAALVFLYFNSHSIPGHLLSSDTSYYNIALIKKGFASPALYWIARLLFYMSALILMFSFFAIVPRRKTIFTKLGSRTLQVYILHRFLYLPYLQYHWYQYIPGNIGGIAEILLILIIVVFILSLKIFEYPFKWIMSIPVQPLLKEEDK